jgi:hypothetical protein
MWLATYSLSFHIVSEWRPVISLAETLFNGGKQKAQAGPFVKRSFPGHSLEPITRFWQALTLNWIQHTQRKRDGNEERGGGKEIAQNGQGS